MSLLRINDRKKIYGKWLFMVLLALMLLPVSGRMTSHAEKTKTQNMIRAAKKNVIKKRAAKILKKKKGIRLRYEKTHRYVKNEWVFYRNNVYCFDKDGFARTGFFRYKGNHYYADEEGHVLYRQWLQIEGRTYYLKKNGTRCEEEKYKYRGITYDFNKKGVLTGSNAKGEKYCFVGDSRTEGMGMAVSNSDTRFIGKVSAGYWWLSNSAASSVRSWASSHPGGKVFFNFGINDPDNLGSYIRFYQNMVQAYPRVIFYFISVNPTHRSSLNARVVNFNSRLRAVFGKRYIDTYSYLQRTGYSTHDGVHYSLDTYRRIYQFVLSKID